MQTYLKDTERILKEQQKTKPCAGNMTKHEFSKNLFVTHWHFSIILHQY